MAEPTVAVEAPVTAEGDLLPAREVDLGRAVRLGLVGGLTAVFVSANGMVEAFSKRALLGRVTLGSLLLVAVPLLVGYLAGRPPPDRQGFATPRPGRPVADRAGPGHHRRCPRADHRDGS